MAKIAAVVVGLLGLLLVVVGVSLWVFGDSTNLLVTIPLASTGVLWAPLIWFLGIIVLLSAALANTLQIKNYVAWILLLIIGYLAVFAIIVSTASFILP